MSTAKRLEFEKHGDPAEVLALKDFTLPTQLPSGYVRIHVLARPINPADLIFVSGNYDRLVGSQIAQGKPQIGGAEGAGVIIQTASDVTGFKVGQRVYVSQSFPNTGTWSEFLDVPAGYYIIPLPDNVSFSAGCQLFVNPLTAHGFLHTLQHEEKLVAGDFVVFTAGASSLVKMVLDMLRDQKHLGYHPVVVVRREDQRKALEALGATVITTETQDVKTRLQELTGGRGVKVVFDALAGGPVVEALFDSLQKGGIIYIYGGLEYPKPLTFNVLDLLFQEKRVAGWYLGQQIPKWDLGKTLAGILESIGKGVIKCESVEFDLVTQWKDALKYMSTPGAKGKPVLTTKQ